MRIDPGALPLLASLAVAVLMLFVLVFQAHQEAATYNRCHTSGPAMTAWDAFFAELRIDNCD